MGDHYSGYYDINIYFDWGTKDGREGKEPNLILAEKDSQYMEGYDIGLRLRAEKNEKDIKEKNRIGPRALPERLSCKGCPALKTEWWKDYLDNDETDSGTAADCTAANNKSISAYWHDTTPVPSWCPANE